MKNDILKKTYIIIPAFNEAEVIGDVIDSVKKQGYKNIIVVDDGSIDHTFKVAKSKNCITLRHLINRGKGAATQTGIDAARLLGAEIAVTIDADGQHDPKDIEKLVEPINSGEYEAVLGSRLMKKENNMPGHRFLMNHLANLVIFFFYGIYVTDSQSGFRAYSKDTLRKINTEMDRYEFDSEVLHIIKLNHVKYKEIPIHVNYTEYSREKYNGVGIQPQNFMNGIKMFLKMIIRSILS